MTEMSRGQVSALLTFIAAYDGRTWADEIQFASTVEAWHECISGGVSFDEARAAVTAHYRQETRRIMPADILGGARATRLPAHRKNDWRMDRA